MVSAGDQIELKVSLQHLMKQADISRLKVSRATAPSTAGSHAHTRRAARTDLA